MAADGPPTILVVDDDAVSVLSIRRALRRIGNAGPLEVAHDGEAALSCLERLARTPTIVLLDLNMPGMGGIEFLETLAREGMPPATRILVLVGLDTPAALDAHRERIAGTVLKDDLPASLERVLAAMMPDRAGD